MIEPTIIDDPMPPTRLDQIPRPLPQPEQQPPQQDMQYQEVPLSQDELYANVMNENRIQNLIAQISPDNQLFEIEMRIKGYKKNIYTAQWEKINTQGEDLSELLVSRYIAFLSTILNQNTSLSNLSAPQINKIMKICIEWLTDDLDSNSVLYDLTSDYSERSRVGYMMLNVLFLVLNRCRDGMESRRMWKALNVTGTDGINPQKKGAFEFMKFWK